MGWVNYFPRSCGAVASLSPGLAASPSPLWRGLPPELWQTDVAQVVSWQKERWDPAELFQLETTKRAVLIKREPFATYLGKNIYTYFV